MQFLLLPYLDESQAAAMSETEVQEEFSAHRAYTKMLIDAGVLQAGNALQPTATARSVRMRDGKKVSTDGPFAETKEQLGGYYLIDCADIETAVAWAAKMPTAFAGTVEVRPILDY